MENISRSKNAKLNIIVGYVVQVLILILSFVCRKVFLNYLTIDYLGINGLFTNILNVLSLAELGVGNVILFSLYEPVAKKQTNRIISLMHFANKIYIAIACGVFVLGLIVIPWMNYIVETDIDKMHVILYYIMFLINTVATYISASKVAFLSANQDLRSQKTITLVGTLLQNILQIIVLIIWKNYVGYLAVQVCCTILINITVSIFTTKQYPFLRGKETQVDFERKEMFKNIFSTFLYKIGTILINNTDNILISILVSTAAVGYYSNYLTVTAGIQAFITIITTALISGVGNLNTEHDKKNMYLMFKVLLLFYHCIAAIGGIGIYYLINDFITMWLGSQYLFDQPTVFAIALNFYLTNAISPIWMYREAIGLFTRVRYLMLTTAIINLILSIIMGKLWGVFGILFASSIARLLTTVWYEPFVLFKSAFKVKVRSYWGLQFKFFLCTLFVFFSGQYICSHLDTGLLFFVIKGILIVAICLIFFGMTSFKSEEFKWIRNKIFR